VFIKLQRFFLYNFAFSYLSFPVHTTLYTILLPLLARKSKESEMEKEEIEMKAKLSLLDIYCYGWKDKKCVRVSSQEQRGLRG